MRSAPDPRRPLTRREFLRLTATWALGSSLAGLGGFGYLRAIEPDWLDVQAVRVRLPRLAAAFHGYRIVQISDIHMKADGWMTPAHLTTIVALVNQQQPDLIVMTGDFVTGQALLVADALGALLRPLRAPDGVLAIAGNHDQGGNRDPVRAVIRAGGMIDLNNALYTLQRGGALLHITGVDDILAGQDRLDLVLARLPPEGAVILLVHEPDFADTAAATGRFDLQLSGHSHGGQVILPGLGPLYLPPAATKYWLGRYQVGSLTVYTNRGLGMIHPFIRFNCRPEITVFTLEAGQG